MGDQRASWAHIAVAAPSKPATSATHRLEFNWKQVKQGRLRPSKITTPSICAQCHCQDMAYPCRQPECIARIQRQLHEIQDTVASFSLTFQTRLVELDSTRQDIHESCKTDSFFSAEMEKSRLEVIKVRCKKQSPISCDCLECQLLFLRKELELFREKVTAADNRLNVLREYRLANDTGALRRTSSRWSEGGKYFTPVGRAKANGVSALRPTLQMQASYNFAALGTNAMETRPLRGLQGKTKR